MAPCSIAWCTPFSIAGRYWQGAALERLHPQEHFTELAGTTGLLLVPVMAFGVAGDGFAIGDAWWMRHHLDAVALTHAFQHHLQVQVG
jgi:hypothetical protein